MKTLFVILLLVVTVVGQPRGLMQAKEAGKDISKKWQERSRYDNCWHEAMKRVEYQCHSLLAESRILLALEFTRCHLEGIKMFMAPCSSLESASQCAEKATQDPRILNTYTEYFIHVDNLCQYINEDKFQEQTSELISGLIVSSDAAQLSLESLGRSSNHIIDNIQSSLQAQRELRDSQRNLQEQSNMLWKQNKAHFEHSVESFEQLSSMSSSFITNQQKIAKMQDNLSKEQHSLLNIHKDTKQQVDSILKGTSTVEKSLGNLVNQQNAAFSGVLQNLHQLDERSTRTISKLFEHTQHVGTVNQRVMGTLQKILDFQEFLSFDFLDLKSFLFYLVALLMLLIVTSAERTHHARPYLVLLYLATMCTERITVNREDFYQDQEILIWMERKVALVLALGILLLCIHSYRDYVSINHQLLQSISKQLQQQKNKKDRSLRPSK